MEPWFTNDAVVLGLLMVILALIMWTSRSLRPFWVKFYTYVPALLLCYFLPALLNWPLGWVSGEESSLYFVASRYLLPASLILLCLSIDFKAILNLGPKALIMFLTGTLGVVLGGPFAIIIVTQFFPELINVPPDELWRGLSTVAGSWIGGGANQTAMKEIFEVGDNLFGSMLVVDIIVANIWMGFLLYGTNINRRIDKWLKADSSAIEALKQKVEDYRSSIARHPTTYSLFLIAAVGFGGTGLAHLLSDMITPALLVYEEGLKDIGLHSLLSDFFWLVVLATTIGLVLSFTRARSLEGVGASQWGSLFIYVLVATIGMKMNLREVFSHLGLFAIGLI